MHLRQLENADAVDLFRNDVRIKDFKILNLLIEIKSYNPHREDESFKIKIKEIRQDVIHQALEVDDLIEYKKKELENGLSPEKIKQFHRFEADESYVGDQCQVCLEEFKVGRLIKQLNCGGRHSFCSVCIDQWFPYHKTCPICRHIFV